MSDFDDAIGDMVEDLLAEAGESYIYLRGAASTTITLRKSQQRGMMLEAASGMLTEVRPTDFIGLTSDFPYDPPERGDRIVGGGKTYEVQPGIGEKVFRRISEKMTRVHTKQTG
jgi:hypothetical protein